jgi:hypothetical protein
MTADKTIATGSSKIYAGCQPHIYYDGDGIPSIYVVAKVGSYTKCYKTSWYDEDWQDMGYPASNNVGVLITRFDGRYIHVVHTPYNIGSYIAPYSRYDCYDDTWDRALRTIHSVGASATYQVSKAIFSHTETFDGYMYAFARLWDDKKGYHQVRWYKSTDQGQNWSTYGDLELATREECFLYGAFCDRDGIIYLWWTNTTYYGVGGGWIQGFAEGEMLGSPAFYNGIGSDEPWTYEQTSGLLVESWLPNKWVWTGVPAPRDYYAGIYTRTAVSGSGGPRVGDQEHPAGSPAYHEYCSYPAWLNTSGSQIMMVERSNISSDMFYTIRAYPAGGWSSINDPGTLYEAGTSVNGVALGHTPVEGYVCLIWSTTAGLYAKCWPSIPPYPFGGEADGLFLF